MNERKLTKVYMYTRVSTAMQVDGFSLSAQKTKIQDYCKYREFKIVGEYSDEGKSGTDLVGRKNFQQMLSDICNKKDDVKYVIVFKLSRFARNTRDALNSLRLMQDHGVELIVTEENIDTSTDMGEVVMTMLSTFAELELKNIHAQTLAGRVQKANEGKWNGGFAPYGYKLINGKLEICKEEADDVKTIFKTFISVNDESFGYAELSKWLMTRNIKKHIRQNATLDYFDEKFLKKMLSNEIYIGKLVYGKRTNTKKAGKSYAVNQTDETKIVRAKGIHQPIIDLKTWSEAQEKIERISKKRRITEKEDKHIYILSSLVKCPFCGCSMYGGVSRKKKKDGSLYAPSYNYSCKRKLKPDGTRCTQGKQFNAKEIDREFGEILSSFFWKPNFREALLKTINTGFNITELEKDYNEMIKNLEVLNARQTRIENEIDSLDVCSSLYEEQHKSVNNRLNKVFEQKIIIQKAIAEQKKLIENAKNREIDKEEVYGLIIDLGEYFTKLKPSDQKKIARAFVDRIEVFPEKRAYGYIKSIHFSIPIISKNKIENQYTIWDAYPNILDEEGNFNGYDPSVVADWDWDKNELVNATADIENDDYNETDDEELEKLDILQRINEQIEKDAVEKISHSIRHIVECVALIIKQI